MRVLFFLAALVLVSCSKEDIEISQGGGLSSEILEISQGGGLSSEILKEKIVVLNIWADWCPPCIVEMPYFNKLNNKEDVIVLGFHFDQFDVLETREVNKLIAKFNVEFKNLITDPRDIWGIEIPIHVPTTYIIKNNKVVETLITPQTYESLIEATEI
tara:strand:+ start:178 stop:651 length:474 start_codon:yes stop_codon:yes gene_type:complete